VLRVGLRVVGEQFGQCVVAFQQAVAPAFQLVQVGGVLLRAAFPGVQFCDDGCGIHVAHQPADVLHLAALRTELVDAVHLVDCVAQGFRQVELRELVLAERDQFLPDVLQFKHLLLDLGFAGG
jgi:hypothetical protein